MPRQDGLVLPRLFNGKPAHLVGQAYVKAERVMILAAKSKYFRCQSITQVAELRPLSIVGSGDSQAADALRSKCFFLIDPNTYWQFSAHPEIR